jgi:hypothetical protein
VITGGVISNITNHEEKSLPGESIYFPILDQYKATNLSQEGGMKTEEYARAVVGRLVKPQKPREMWEGTNSTIVRFVSGYLPGRFGVSSTTLNLEGCKTD